MAGKVYLSMVRPAMDTEPTGPYGHIIGAYSNHRKAEDAIRKYYRKIASDAICGRIEYFDDLTARITTANGSIVYIGSILKKPVW